MKMERPEVDVVRFTESDVMCASPAITAFKITGANDGVANNMKIDNVDVANFESVFKPTSTSNSYFKYQENKPVHISDLDKHDVSGDLEDGSYVDQGELQITEDIFGRLWWCQ